LGARGDTSGGLCLEIEPDDPLLERRDTLIDSALLLGHLLDPLRRLTHLCRDRRRRHRGRRRRSNHDGGLRLLEPGHAQPVEPRNANREPGCGSAQEERAQAEADKRLCLTAAPVRGSRPRGGRGGGEWFVHGSLCAPPCDGPVSAHPCGSGPRGSWHMSRAKAKSAASSALAAARTSPHPSPAAAAIRGPNVARRRAPRGTARRAHYVAKCRAAAAECGRTSARPSKRSAIAFGSGKGSLR